MSFYVTGDTHGEIDLFKLNKIQFPQQKLMTRSDYVLICGDWGGVWSGQRDEKWLLDWYAARNFTTLVVLGNHENYDAIESQFPVTEWRGGKVRFVRENVIILERGQVFEIDDRKIFVMGGAASIDKESRQEGISWWSRELPSYAEQEEAFKNLEAVDNKVDYVFTHTCPTELVPMLTGHTTFISYYKDPTTILLSAINEQLEFKDWYFGHFHCDKDMGEFHCRYDKITKLW